MHFRFEDQTKWGIFLTAHLSLFTHFFGVVCKRLHLYDSFLHSHSVNWILHSFTFSHIQCKFTLLQQTLFSNNPKPSSHTKTKWWICFQSEWLLIRFYWMTLAQHKFVNSFHPVNGFCFCVVFFFILFVSVFIFPFTIP